MEMHIHHWLYTNGIVSNACVGRFGDQAMSLEVRGMCNLVLMALATIDKLAKIATLYFFLQKLKLIHVL